MSRSGFGWHPWAKRSFRFWQRLGLTIIPNHFYHPVPDLDALPDRLWERPSELPGVDMNGPGQLELLRLFTRFREEYEALPREKPETPHRFFLNNGMFGKVDAEILYCMIRHFRPRRIWEIGSGFSTLLAAQAALVNATESRTPWELVAFEPYPRKLLRDGFPGLTRLVTAPIQDVPLAQFTALGESDILFIDSSHVVKAGSDVEYELLELIPRLNPGVLVHVHDIGLPEEYARELLFDHHIFWNEQYLLHAFLLFNTSWEVLWAGNWMRLNHPDEVAAAFSSFQKGDYAGGSFWMRRIR